MKAAFNCLDRLVAEDALACAGSIGLAGQVLELVLPDRNHVPVRPANLLNDQCAVPFSRELKEEVPEIGLRTFCPPSSDMRSTNQGALSFAAPIAAQGPCSACPERRGCDGTGRLGQNTTL